MMRKHLLPFTRARELNRVSVSRGRNGHAVDRCYSNARYLIIYSSDWRLMAYGKRKR